MQEGSLSLNIVSKSGKVSVLPFSFVLLAPGLSAWLMNMKPGFLRSALTLGFSLSDSKGRITEWTWINEMHLKTSFGI